jgi:hypothetical protein
VEHVEEHDLTTDDVDHVLENYESKDFSASSGCPCVFGYTPDGRYIIVVTKNTMIRSIPKRHTKYRNRERRFVKWPRRTCSISIGG